MWSWIVIYRKDRKNYVQRGGRYHYEMVAQSMMQTFLDKLDETCRILGSQVNFVQQKDDNAQTCLQEGTVQKK